MFQGEEDLLAHLHTDGDISESMPSTVDTDKPEESTSRRKRKIKLNAELLAGEDGVKKLLKVAKHYPLYIDYPSELVDGKEHKYSRKLLDLFEDWASNLCPSTDLDDVFLKIEKLANNVIVKSALEEAEFKLSEKSTSRVE